LPEAIFVAPRVPDDPRAFGSGQIGIPLPTYYQRYLYLAYRALSGQALAGNDLDAALAVPASSYGEDQPWYTRWRSVRDSLGLAGHRDYVSLACARQRGDVFYFYPNYYDDAFRAATQTLLDRVKRQGGVDASVRDWMEAQDAVFYACAYESSSVPTAVPSGSPDWLAKDRAYQVASWDFYSGRFDEANTAFGAIGQDRASPWHDWGAYLAARAMVRKGTVTPDLRVPNREALAQAEKQLEAVLADPSLADRHGSARRLLSFARLRLDPAKRLAEVCQALVQPHLSADASQQVFDLTALLDRFEPAQVDSLAKTNRDDELADWILTFQSTNYTHALERWRATKSVSWLVAALSSASNAPADLMNAAAKVPASDPGYAAAQFHRARLLAAAGKDEEARHLLDELARAKVPPSALNLTSALRMRLARNFDEFLANAGRVPTQITGYDFNGNTLTPSGVLLDHDAGYLLNRWAPTSSIARAASAKSDSALRYTLSIAAWTRAAVLDDDATVSRLSASLAEQAPALVPYVRAVTEAKDADSRRFETTWLLLHAPGMSPWVRWGVGRTAAPPGRDIFRDNWWPVESAHQRAWFLGDMDSKGDVGEAWTNPQGWDGKLARAIFSPEEQKRAEAERAALTEAGPGANYVCAQTLAWAESHPADPRLPEALHLCVQATRFGYTDDRTTDWSRKAFTFLHRRFPGNPWTSKTKYWY